jgi:hypothetical protein
LDKYERSAAYRTGEASYRRILLKLYDGKGQTDFSWYDIGDHDRRIEINEAIEELAARGILAFEWMRGERGHLIEKVWLPFDQIEGAYRLINRSPKATAVDTILAQAGFLLEKVKSDWAKQYFEDIWQKGMQKRDFGHSIPQEDTERRDLWKVISYLDDQQESALEIVERVISMQLFSDSKRFEQALRPKLLSVLRKYLDTDKVYDTDEELLRQIGIVKYPEYFEFCGALSLINEDSMTDFSPLVYGSSLNVVDLQIGTLLIPEQIKRILSIENRANYFDYLAKNKSRDELVLYHGGQYSPSKKKFFTAISHAMPEGAMWLHWSDIDLGGFLMLGRLRREINPNIIPYRMNERELETYRPYTRSISESYVEKLRSLMNKTELADCTSCIAYMINQSIRLEQESMLVSE